MKKINETGHQNNLANFEVLISRCTGYGVAYNPSLGALQIAGMNTLRTSALNALANEAATHMTLQNAINDRDAIYEPLQKFATRVINALKACGASKALIKDAQTINRKIQGKRAKALPEKEKPVSQKVNPGENQVLPVEEKHHSVSRQSHDSMVEHYARLIELLAAVPAYNPNEAALSIAGLNTLLNSMKTSTTAVINTNTAWISARLTRDAILYGKDTGLIDVALEVKSYVKSVFGANSPEYKEISGLKFTRR